jgi:hypothetical protein
MRMVEYYGCTGGVYPTDIILLRGDPDELVIKKIPEGQVETEQFSTFAMLQDFYGGRQIEAFEVELEQVDQAIVGWTQKNAAGKKMIKKYLAADANIWFTFKCDKCTFGLDCTARRLCGKSQTHNPTEVPPLEEGAIIRCEREGGKWFLNGSPIGSRNDFMRETSLIAIQ